MKKKRNRVNMHHLQEAKRMLIEGCRRAGYQITDEEIQNYISRLKSDNEMMAKLSIPISNLNINMELSAIHENIQKYWKMANQKKEQYGSNTIEMLDKITPAIISDIAHAKDLLKENDKKAKELEISLKKNAEVLADEVLKKFEANTISREDAEKVAEKILLDRAYATGKYDITQALKNAYLNLINEKDKLQIKK